MRFKKQLIISFSVLFFITCTTDDNPISVEERIAEIVAASTNPASDGTPTLEDLAAAGVRNATGSQTAYEEAIATANPAPITLTELQKIIDSVSSLERIAEIVAASTKPASGGTPTLEDLAAAGVKNATGSQTAYEEAIATANPAPITLTELQKIIDSVSSLGNNDVLKWSDEFDTPGAPSAKNWTYDIDTGDGGGWGWGNGESQYYTNRTENVIVEDGLLKIIAKKESYRGSNYTSARLKTQGKYSFTYGKVEVKAKLPAKGGTWPAIWMLGINFPTVGWPACGEIDIMEQTGADKGSISSALHNLSSAGNTQNVGHTSVSNATSEFHVYAVNWTPTKMDFSVDGEIFYTYNPTNKNDQNWPYTANQFIILNIAMGGTLGGTIDADFTQDTMEIDYVRVYQ